MSRKPDLRGRSVTRALTTLERAGHPTPEITYVDDAGPAHVVLDQTPAPGVPDVDRICLEVSGRSPLRYLPGVFRRADNRDGGFLRRMLWPFAHLLHDIDRGLREIPAMLDPGRAPDPFLPWLRRLVALPLDLPPEAIHHAPRLWSRKGTVRGIVNGLRALLGIRSRIQVGSYSLSPWWIGPGAAVGVSRLRGRGGTLPAAFEVILSGPPGPLREVREVIDLLKPAHTICRIRFPKEETRRPPPWRVGGLRLEDHHGDA